MAKMPNRNRSNDNPYKLDFNEESNTYTVEFCDSQKNIHKIEISYQVYLAFDKFELEDISQIHKFRNHIEHLELSEEMIHDRMFESQKSIEEIVEDRIMKDELKEAINSLSETQRRRIKMYYFENMTLQEISKLEECSVKNVFKSIELAKMKLKKFLKK